MTTKKPNAAAEKPADPEEVAATSTAEEELETQLSEEEMLADLPTLRAPHRLRLRHKNRVKSIGFRFYDRISALGVKAKDGSVKLKTEHALTMLDLAAELDEFAESIAEDPEEYELWAEAHSDEPEVFFAILNRYQAALGESNGSAS